MLTQCEVQMRRPPLGQHVGYSSGYTPGLLAPVARADARRALGLSHDLPFTGLDIWNAYELTWLAPSGKPEVASATIEVPSHSDNIVESKSLKLYLNSLSGSHFESAEVVSASIARDVGAIVGTEVAVTIHRDASGNEIRQMPGECIDEAASDDGQFEAKSVSPTLLATASGPPQSEELYSELLRSLCPVTGQPDSASILIRYQGSRIERLPLLQYLVSYRQHSEFHEGCVERAFMDISEQCQPEKLSVYARFNRRGGIDINPFRSNFEDRAPNIRLWRQ